MEYYSMITSTNIHNKMDELQMHPAQRKEERPPRVHTDSIFMKFWKKEICRDRKQISDCQELRLAGGSKKGFGGKMELFCIFDGGGCMTTYLSKPTEANTKNSEFYYMPC